MKHYHGTPIGGTRQDAARFLIGRHALVPHPQHEFCVWRTPKTEGVPE